MKRLASLLIAAHVAVMPADYRALVDAYRRNGTPEVNELLSMPPDAVKAALQDATGDASGWTWQETRAAAILHSDGVLQLLKAGNKARVEMHLDAAQRLLDRTMKLESRQEDFVWRWYTLMPELLKTLDASAFSPALRRYALERWPSTTGRTLLLRGITLESKGNLHGRVPRPGESALMRGTDDLQTTWFAAASEAYSAALRVDSQLQAARVHLGRIRMLEGQRAAAASLFREALASVDPTVVYLAALFLGSIEEREDRFTTAEAFYKQANDVWPHGQAGALALSQLLSRVGRESEAREVLASRLKSGTRPVEPMWTYSTNADDAGTRFDMLRAEVWR